MRYRVLKYIEVTVNAKAHPHLAGVRNVFEAIAIESGAGSFGMPTDTKFAIRINGVYIPTLDEASAAKAIQRLAGQAACVYAEPLPDTVYES